ncbi:hypothetical protein MSAN_00516600 [Mycena sanguinolenta]|uniref:Uncharacterized protein n=1 Tax=Mycena sanguinolenta TaxID=230812 RepID=A0A8H6Z687_9AGAR|nr:hypothetical protein MSAN_00516600 [Mycena sanguinolenta]
MSSRVYLGAHLSLFTQSPHCSLISLAPLLFTEFVFHPPETKNHARKERDEVQFAKLAFWSSPRIAPLVRRCVVNFADICESIVTAGMPEWVASRGVPRSWFGVTIAKVEKFFFGEFYSPALVLACLEAVSRFTNLEDLTCRTHWCCFGVELAALRVHHLPLLKSLRIITADLLPSVEFPSTKLKVEHFSYTNMPTPQPGRRSQMHCLDPAILRRVDLSSRSFDPMVAVKHFLEDTHMQASFQNLHVVNLAVWETTFMELHASIAPYPAIRELSVKIKSRTLRLGPLPSPATPMAPQLSTFKGPPDLLPLILVGANPHTLHLSRGPPDRMPFRFESQPLLTLDTWRGPAAELVRVLRSCGPSVIHSVTSLILPIHYHDIPVGSSLGDSLAFFPALETLRVVVYSGPRHAVPPMTDRALCARLGTILRPFDALRTVAFDWGLNGNDPSEKVPPLSMLNSVLRDVIIGFESAQYEYFDAWPDFDEMTGEFRRRNEEFDDF